MQPEARKGRGAASNRTGRFESLALERVDDGWGIADEPLPPLETTVQAEPPTNVIPSGSRRVAMRRSTFQVVRSSTVTVSVCVLATKARLPLGVTRMPTGTGLEPNWPPNTRPLASLGAGAGAASSAIGIRCASSRAATS